MFKKLLILAFAGLLSPAYAAGTIPGFSLAQQQDSDGTPLIGCKLFTIQAGTTSTPQSAYQDSGLTIPLSNPVICDAFGRLPQIFLADGSIKLRLTKSNGVQVFAADGILVVGASSGGGGGSPVDATTILATGDLKITYGTGILSGFVRANGRTIGSATSGATERANADTQALYAYLWNTDANLVVSTGRGASAANDFAANKTIALPDWRGRAIAGLDDMGNSVAGRLTATYFGSTGGCSGVLGTTLGAGCGGESQTLTLAQAPTGITSSAPTMTNPGQLVGGSAPTVSILFASSASGVPAGVNTPFGALGNGTAAAFTPSFSGSTSNNTGGAAHPIASPMMLATIHIKL